MPQNKPLISVILPAYNAKKTIRECVDSLLNQSYGNYEVIVVDNNSKDSTQTILKSYGEKISFLVEKKKGSFAARNTGVRNSKGDILAFVDSDCVVEKNWLEKLTKPLISEGESAAYGGSTDVEKTRWSKMEHVYEKRFMECLSEDGCIQMGDTKNLAIARKVFEELGGFDETFEWSGDTDFGLRLVEAGYKIRVAEGCEVKHYFKATLWRITRGKFRHGYWGLTAYLKHKKHLRDYGRVLGEVKQGLYFLILGVLFLLASPFAKELTSILLLFSLLGLISSAFMIIGSTHTTIPIIKKGLSDYNIYGLVHSAAWRLGALWYILKNPLSLHEIP